MNNFQKLLILITIFNFRLGYAPGKQGSKQFYDSVEVDNWHLGWPRDTSSDEKVADRPLDSRQRKWEEAEKAYPGLARAASFVINSLPLTSSTGRGHRSLEELKASYQRDLMNRYGYRYGYKTKPKEGDSFNSEELSSGARLFQDDDSRISDEYEDAFIAAVATKLANQHLAERQAGNKSYDPVNVDSVIQNFIKAGRPANKNALDTAAAAPSDGPVEGGEPPAE